MADETHQQIAEYLGSLNHLADQLDELGEAMGRSGNERAGSELIDAARNISKLARLINSAVGEMIAERFNASFQSSHNMVLAAIRVAEHMDKEMDNG
jgi:hypothetical protein